MKFRGKVLSKLALAVALVSCLANAIVRAQGAPVVAAASDLQFAVDEIAKRFQSETRREVRLAFGSSGNFFRQIGQGGPFQIFMSADEDFVFRLADAGLVEDRGVLYATGRIVLFAPSGSAIALDERMQGVRAAIGSGQIRRFAIANPEHAPYGRAAEEAIRSLGLWDSVKPLLVLGENVSQAAQFAMSGSAQVGIFAYSLALAPQFQGRGSYILLPETLHKPLRQRMALVRGVGDDARAFYRYLQEPSARAIFKRYGFVLPGE